MKLWNVTSGKVLQMPKGYSLTVNNVPFSQDGAKVASGSNDRIVKVWDVKNVCRRCRR